MRRDTLVDIAGGAMAGVLAALIIPWKGFIDPDAFYHATMAQLLFEGGPLHAFPWLDLTLFGQHFADIHLSFHAVVAPFVQFFGDLQGLRVASVILIGLLGMAISYAYRSMGIKAASFWVILLFLTEPFMLRISLGKATPLALIWFILGIAAWWMGSDVLLAFLAFAFALTHNAWAFLACAIGVLAFGRLLYARIVQSQSWTQALKGTGWRGLIACAMGGLLGMAVHPNGLNIFQLSWTTLVSIGLMTPIGSVPMGMEWQPLSQSTFLIWFGGWIVLIALGMAGFAFAPKRNIGHVEGRLVTSLVWLVAVLTAMTLKSSRVAEYLAPVLALFCGSLWSCIDVPVMAQQMGLARKDGKINLYGIGIVVLVLGVFLKGGLATWKDFHGNVYADDIYVTTTRAIAERARPGDRVFNARWDDFPMLFHADRNVLYVSGLDPVLFQAATSTLSKDYNELTFGSTTPTRERAWSVIHDRLGSRFVFISSRGQQRLYATVSTDPRYQLIAESEDSVAYQIGE